MRDSDDEARRQWAEWREEREAAVSAPYGPLSLTGTHWLAEAREGRIPAIPGLWREAADGVLLHASADDGLTVDGRPFAGDLVLGADRGEPAAARVVQGDRRLVVMAREGDWAVRVFDPAAENRRSFAGIVATAP
ncbi:DUF1684 domain-containing protein, partial [Streptomyces sp. URMC 123]